MKSVVTVVTAMSAPYTYTAGCLATLSLKVFRTDSISEPPVVLTVKEADGEITKSSVEVPMLKSTRILPLAPLVAAEPSSPGLEQIRPQPAV